MGGSGLSGEGDDQKWSNVGIDSEEFKTFAAQDAKSAATLSRFRYETNGTETRGFFKSDGGKVAQGVWQPAMDKFRAFTQAQGDMKQAHEQYVKMANAKPGRQSTILTPMSGPESKTLLGADMSAYGKTVLG